MPTSAQIRAARGLLGWSQADLAPARLHPRTIERAERGEGITVRTLRAIAGGLEAGGMKFLQNQNGLGLGLGRG